MDLNVNVLKALGSETRLLIIKNLKERRMTLTELSKKSGMHASTVKEHLDFLARAGLVEQKDEGRKWKYYSLTQECKRLLSPYPSEIRILIPLALVLFTVGLSSGNYSYVNNEALSDMVNGASKPIGNATQAIATSLDTSSILILLACVFVIISAYLVARKYVFLERLGKNPRI